MKHPRARFIVVYGRKPVLEALETPGLDVHRLRIAASARGHTVDAIVEAARARGVTVERVPAAEVSKISRRPHQDQGVVLDVEAPHMDDLGAALAAGLDEDLFVLPDGVTTPANLGMLLRTCVAVGAALVLPGRGVADLGPRVIKASAGTAFRARILRDRDAPSAASRLAAHGIALVGLDAAADVSLFEAPPPRPAALVVGGETHGITPAVRRLLDARRKIPLAPGAESLNAAVAGAVAMFEARRAWGAFG
ncbi:MAG: RNA methyltransferase [Deltaproteobacteria bacterium]|nr:MAG: RNA methyltransferase [Deltaproteobacteria bacterium]